MSNGNLLNNSADLIKVFVITIQHTDTRGEYIGSPKVGACYWNEQAALEECYRLEAANRWTCADYLTRELPFPTLLQTLTDDDLGDKLCAAGLTYTQTRAILEA